jgi:hypothetical protein
MDVARAVSLHAFRDTTGAMGRVAYDLGNVYRIFPPIHNSSPLFWALQFPVAELAQPRDSLAQALVSRFAEALTPETFGRALDAIDAAMEPLDEHRMSRPDAELIEREFTNAARLLRHACQRATALLDGSLADPGARRALEQDLQAAITEYRQLWLARNRPGGLEDSAGRLERSRADYVSG